MTHYSHMSCYNDLVLGLHPYSVTDLVSCANVLLVAVQVNSLGNVRRLLLQSHQHIAGLIIET